MIEILDCPFAGEIKGDLVKWFKLDKQKHSSGLVLKSKEHIEPDTPEIKRLFDWIEGEIPNVAIKLAQHSNSLFNADFRRNTANFKIDAYWGLYYNHNSFVYPHTHFPHAMSFGYYINVPVGSSPFTLMHNNKEDMDFYPKEGQLFVFDSSIQHVVNPSPVKGRMMLAGDIVYLSRFGN